MAPSPLGRGRSPDGFPPPVDLQLAELSQQSQCSLSASSLSPLAPVRVELRCAPVVLGHWLVNKRGPEAVQRDRKPLRIPAACV